MKQSFAVRVSEGTVLLILFLNIIVTVFCCQKKCQKKRPHCQSGKISENRSSDNPASCVFPELVLRYGIHRTDKSGVGK